MEKFDGPDTREEADVDTPPFSAKIWVKAVQSKEELKTWCEKFDNSSLTIMSISKSKYTFPLKSGLIAKVSRTCRFATARKRKPNPPPESGKTRKRENNRTGCPASMVLTIYKEGKIGGFHLLVDLEFRHDHPIECADALRHRPSFPFVKEEFISLFKCGHSPSSALYTYKVDLLKRHGANYYKVAGDGAYLPDRYRVRYWYSQEFTKAYGTCNEDDMIQRLIQQGKDYDENFGEGGNCVKVEVHENQIIVVILTPLMKRYHTTKEAADIVGIDSGRSYDRHNVAIWHITTKSYTMSVPLGLMITTSESAAILTKALEIYKSMLPSESFGGKGRDIGPEIVMRDDSAAENAAISQVWPNTKQLQCIFHVLQAVWRWLWDSDNQIAKADRPYLLCLFRDIMYDIENDIKENMKNFKKDKLVMKYKNYKKYIEEQWFSVSHQWALVYRLKLPLHGMNTNNATEAAIKLSKEQVFQRIKAFNIPQTLDFILTRFDLFYEIKMTLVASNRSGGFHKLGRGYINDGKKGIRADSVQNIGDEEYTVPSETTSGKIYRVNLNIGYCECPVGKWGGPCKHQDVAAYASRTDTPNSIPVNCPKTRQKIHYLATGNTTVKESWWRQKTSKPDIREVENTSTPTNNEAVERAVDSEQQDEDEYTLPPTADENGSSTESGNSEREYSELDKLLDEVVTDIKSQYRKDKSFMPSVRKFCQTYKYKLKYPIARRSALHTFGNAANVRIPRKKFGTKIRTTTNRKRKFAETKLSAGLNPRAKLQKISKTINHKDLPTKTQTRKPHRLGKLVKDNKSVSKDHSRKTVHTPIAHI